MTRPLHDLPDQALLDYIFAQLNQRMAAYPEEPLEGHLRGLAQLPRGLHAMATTYALDANLAISGLAWHFAQWSDARFTAETLRGLRELDAEPLAHTVETAWQLVRPYLRDLAASCRESSDTFEAWYRESALAEELTPLDEDLRSVLSPEHRGIYHLWLAYARKHPERLS